MTRWSPDTCLCVIEYDDSSLVATAVINKCQKHTSFATPSALLTSLQNHNRQKNNVLNWLIANAATLGLSFDANGTLLVACGYKFSGASAIEPVIVSVPTFNATQIASLQTSCDGQFGANRTVVTSGPIPA